MGSTPVGISGSRAAAILGMSKYTTPFAVWQQIMETLKPGFNAERGYILEPFEGNASTRFGLSFESSVIELTEAATGKAITDREGEYYIDGAVPITCHIDGRFSNPHIFEGKTVYSRGFDKFWGESGTDRIPVEYQCQVQNNMMVTGAESCTVGALVFPRSPQEWEDEGWRAYTDVNQLTHEDMSILHLTHEDKTIKTVKPIEWAESLAEMGYFHTYEIQAKPDTHKLLKEMYADFWNKYVLTETPPENDLDYDDIKRMFTAPKGELLVPQHIVDKCLEYKSIGKEIGSGGYLKKKQAQLKLEIVDYLKDKTTVESDESQEKVTCLDATGNKVGTFNNKGVFRA